MDKVTVLYTVNQTGRLMDQSRARYLILSLIGNKLSGQELDEVLCGLRNQATASEFSNILKLYFEQLVNDERPVSAKVNPDIFKDSHMQ